MARPRARARPTSRASRRRRPRPRPPESPPPAPPRRCRACARELGAAEVQGWECECGVVVCLEAECFEEYFKVVAGGEGTRCRSCGLLA